MSALPSIVARRHFAARYANVGRAMLGQLADMYGITVEVAAVWADEIDMQNQETPHREHSRRTVAAAARAGMRGASPASTGALCGRSGETPNSRNATPLSPIPAGE